MQLRGRRHWRSVIQLGAAEYGAGAQAGRFLGLTDLLPEQRASVQPVSIMDAAQLGISALVKHYWVRCENPGVLIQPAVNGVLWNGELLIARNVDTTEGDQLELLAEVVTVNA